MPETTLTLWGGVGTIGGTVIEVRHAVYRLVLDLGLPYTPGTGFFAGPVAPRPGAALRDLLAVGAAPAVPGVYRRDLLRGVNLRPGPDYPPADTAVLVSHLHLDHCALVDAVAPGIEVWMHADAVRLQLALREVGERGVGTPRPYSAFDWGDRIAVGPLVATPLPVDHDVPGAAGFVVETPAGAVVYTGDLRAHGCHPEHVEAFVAAARAAQPVALVIEGTLLSPGPAAGTPPVPEAEVAPRAADLAARSPGLALVNVYPRHVERLACLATAMAGAGRRLALEAPVARVLQQMGVDLGQVAIYLTEAQRAALVRGRAPGWLEELLVAAAGAGAPVVGAAEVREDPRAFCLQISLPNLPELVDLHPAPGSVLIHAGGEPVGAFDPAWDLYRRWLNHFGVELAVIACPGHATAADLERIAAAIAPRVVIPVHSLHPDRLAPPGLRRLLPEQGVTYNLASL